MNIKQSMGLSALISLGVMSSVAFAVPETTVRADFDGDGFDDLAVGAPFEDVAGVTNVGAIHVFYSNTVGLDEAADVLNLTNCPFTDQADDRFGTVLAVGDFDGDAFSDLAIGIPLKDLSVGLPDAGGVLIVYGSAAGLVCNNGTAQFWSQNSSSIQGRSEASDLFGFALAAGNFDGDAFTDLSIGVPGENINNENDVNAGAVHVLYGASTGLVPTGNQLFTQADGLSGAAEDGDQVGRTLVAGNFNGDAATIGGVTRPIDDLAIGAPFEDLGIFNGIEEAGGVNVIYGTPSGLTSSGQQFWSQNTGSMADPAEDGDRFSTTLAAGNFDGNVRFVNDVEISIDDLAIGVPDEDLVGSNGSTLANAGAVNVIYGKTSGLDDDNNQFWNQNAQDEGGFQVAGIANENDRFGTSLVAVDFSATASGRGFDDLAIGVPGEDVSGDSSSGAVHVLYGAAVPQSGPFVGGLRAFGEQFLHQGRVVDNVEIRDGTEPADNFGFALGAGDFNGDRAADLAVGVPFEDLIGVGSSTANVGAVNVIYGTNTTTFGDGGLTGAGNQFLSGAGQDARLGSVVSQPERGN